MNRQRSEESLFLVFRVVLVGDRLGHRQVLHADDPETLRFELRENGSAGATASGFNNTSVRSIELLPFVFDIFLNPRMSLVYVVDQGWSTGSGTVFHATST
ncbi:MAG: hypothetical protein U1D30_05545 [Planctomycetota bacterium]